MWNPDWWNQMLDVLRATRARCGISSYHDRTFSLSVKIVGRTSPFPELIMSNMGARVARLFRNFNLENRVHREIGKAKPEAAPRHQTHIDPVQSTQVTEISDAIHKRNDPLLGFLKSVYVESKDPTEAPKEVTEEKEERRPLIFSLPGDPYGIVEIINVPKGKLSIIEALQALNNHKNAPQTWTLDKVALEYSLDLKDTKALLEHFIPFEVKIIPPKTEDAKKIKDI
ncbi:NADH dehydrogenase [ubiquinone] 1 alpha subcomplex assembly factor 4-like [Salvelinus alpinus]